MAFLGRKGPLGRLENKHNKTTSRGYFYFWRSFFVPRKAIFVRGLLGTGPPPSNPPRPPPPQGSIWHRFKIDFLIWPYFDSEKPRIRLGRPSRSAFSQTPRKLLLVDFDRKEYGYRTSWKGGLPALQEPNLTALLVLSENWIPKGTWNDNSRETTQNLMLLWQRLLSFGLVISWLLARNYWNLAAVVSATVASQWWPGGEVVISRLLPPWDPRRLNWNTSKS